MYFIKSLSFCYWPTRPLSSSYLISISLCPVSSFVSKTKIHACESALFSSSLVILLEGCIMCGFDMHLFFADRIGILLICAIRVDIDSTLSRCVQ